MFDNTLFSGSQGDGSMYEGFQNDRVQKITQFRRSKDPNVEKSVSKYTQQANQNYLEKIDLLVKLDNDK